jgi:hypothetical protein
MALVQDSDFGNSFSHYLVVFSATSEALLWPLAAYASGAAMRFLAAMTSFKRGGDGAHSYLNREVEY